MTTPIATLLQQHFDLALDAPDGIKKLRELILTLAMRGKLVPQDPSDQPASELLKEIEAEKKRLVKEGKIKERGRGSRGDAETRREIKPEDMPYEVPKGWPIVSLGEITSLITKGSTPTSYGFAFQDFGIPFIKVENVKKGSIQFNDKMQFISEEAHVFQKRSKLEANDLLFSIAGTIGETCVVKQSDLPANINQALAIIRGYNIAFTTDFLINALNSVVSEKIKNRARGGAMYNISLGDINEMLIPLPPLPEQKRIVARIDQLMALCDALESQRIARRQKKLEVHATVMHQLLDSSSASQRLGVQKFLFSRFNELYTVKENVAELRKAILQLAVMGKLVPQDPNDQPASELLKEMEAEKKRLVREGKIKALKPLPEIKPENVPYEVPVGWEWVRLESIVENLQTGIDRGKQFQSLENNYFYFKMSNISNDGRCILDNFTKVNYEESDIDRYILRDNDFLFNTRNSHELVGKTCVFHSKSKNIWLLNNNILRVVFFSKISPSLINYYFISPLGKIELEKIKSSTTNVAAIYQSQVLNFLIPLPPLPEQKRIVARIDQLIALCDSLEQGMDAATQKQSAVLEAVLARV